MIRLLSAALLVSFAMLSVQAAEPDKKPADANGWVELLQTGEASPWEKVDAGWLFADDASLDTDKPARLKAKGEGKSWVNGEKGRVPDLVTKKEYKDVEVHVEFMMGKNSNSGIKFHAMYEIQFRDTANNKGELSGDDCGGIYPRAEDKPRYHHIDKGIGPKVNAAKPAGEWQTLEVTFQSARFDDKGEKSANAKIVKATFNGKLIHEDQELKTPTGSNWTKKEKAAGPFMLQADHGPVAFRNVKIREIAK